MPPYEQVHAYFRLWQTDLDPDRVTRLFGLTPSKTFRRGDPHGRRGFVRRNGFWMLCSEGHVLTLEPEEHIAWLLNQLEPVAAPLHDLRTEGISADVVCFLELHDYGGPVFSPQVMGRLAALDLALGVSTYWDDYRDVSVAEYLTLLGTFLDSEIDAATFERRYHDLSRTDRRHHHPAATSAILDAVLDDVLAFCADPGERDEDNIDEAQLRERIQAAEGALRASGEGTL